MTILTIFSSPCGLNGAALNLGITIRALTQRGHSVCVLCRKPDPASDHLERCGARTIFFNLPLGMNTTLLLESSHASLWRRILQNLKDIVRIAVGIPLVTHLIRKENPDAVFLMDITLPQCALAAFWASVPVVCEAQEQLIRGYFGLRRRITISILSRCDRLFGITKVHVAPFIPHVTDAGRITVVPNTVDVADTWQAKPSDVLSATHGRSIILFCGGVNENKGFRFATELIHHLVQRDPSCLLIFAGAFHHRYESPFAKGTMNGSSRNTRALFDYIRQHNLEDHVRVVGVRSDILDIMAAAQAVIVPHRVPHFSRPIIEAFAVGTPVVATDDPFNAELIRDGINGKLAPFGDLHAWTHSVEALLKGTVDVGSIIRHARAVYRQRFTTDVVESQLIDIFESLADTPRAQRTRDPQSSNICRNDT